MNPAVPERPAAGGVGTHRFSTIELLAASARRSRRVI
jgi:hypothetical protein